ncbi:MAG: ThuA domain-containing protein [Novosphingobium sp.]
MQERLRVLLVVAAEYHDADYVRRALLDLLAEDARIVTTCTNDFHDTAALGAADLLLTYTSNVFPDEAQRTALREFLQRGGRWFAIHGSAAFTCFRPPAVDIGGIRLPGLTDTPDREPAYMDLLGARFVSHLAQQPIAIHPVSDHPLVAGLPAFTVVDEPYILELRGACEVLLQSRFTGEAPGYVPGPWLEDLPRPQMLLRREGPGAVLYLAPGHCCGPYDLVPFIAEVPVQRGPWEDPTYREILRRAIRWGVSRESEPA